MFSILTKYMLAPHCVQKSALEKAIFLFFPEMLPVLSRLSSRRVINAKLLPASSSSRLPPASDDHQCKRSYYTRLHHIRPRRALMYVPGSDERKLAKIPSLGADCICLDCEDGVATNKKEEARNGIRRLLDAGNVDFGRGECSVRVNCIESGLCDEDLKVVLGGQNLPEAMHLPKVS